MDYDSLCSNLFIDLETELRNRLDELAALENIYSLSGSERYAGVFYKSQIILLYAHFEGYCKRTLLLYVNYINNLNLTVSDVKDGLAATNLYRDFGLLFDTKHAPVSLSDRALKEDRVLQKFGRRREFVGQYRRHLSKQVSIPDTVIDTESNLKSHVLKKLLFILEIDHTIVDDFATDVNELLNKRNAYAHGDISRLPEKQEVERYKSKTVQLMTVVKDAIYKGFSEKHYLKAV